MTICIAARSQKDECIVAICDKMLSYDDLLPATEGAAEKAFWVHRFWYAMMAGDPAFALPVIRRAQKRIVEKTGTGLSTLDENTSAFRRAFQEQLQQEVEDRFLSVYKMDLEAFKKDGYQMLGPQEFAKLHNDIRTFNLDVQLLVFGLGADRFGHIFEVNDSTGAHITEHDLRGYAAIGSGQYMAMGSLVARPLPQLPVEQLIYRLCEAKFTSETAHGVGKETALMVLYRNGRVSMVKPSLIDTIRLQWENERKAEVQYYVAEMIKKALLEAP